MCVVSMVMQHKTDDWIQRYWPPPAVGMPSVVTPLPFTPLPTAQEIEEFRRLLERAREYDRKHNEPDCELAEKRERLKKLATELGVDISFV